MVEALSADVLQRAPGWGQRCLQRRFSANPLAVERVGGSLAPATPGGYDTGTPAGYGRLITIFSTRVGPASRSSQ
jgi:hypothetical protein